MRIRMMVIDDEPDVEAMIRQRLRRHMRSGEIEIIFASDGGDALAKLATAGDLDLVLTDINMPGMDGLTFLTHLGAMRLPTKAIVVSAYGDMRNIRLAMNRGAFDFITKPIEFEDLELTIERTAEEVRQQRKAVRHAIEMDGARLMQAQLLPDPRAFMAGERVDLSARIVQAREVGGDFYDFYRIGADALFLVIGDVSGKGLASGMVMAVAKALTKAAALNHDGDPVRVLGELNRNLCTDNPTLHFVTISVARISLSDGTVEIASAGHEPGLILTADGGTPVTIGADGPPVGIVEDAAFEASRHRLGPDDLLAMMTDGFSEAVDAQGAFYSRDRISDVLANLPPGTNAQNAIDTLVDDVRDHRNGAAQSDDMAILALRWRG